MPVSLKKIVVENFKSYNGETTIGPFQPFTAVIGPNGSGKSNFMDAISFVMGEKTSKLRVKRLGELIHGASVGKPVGNSASVTAVFDSENGTEVTFKRSVQNSSSEYRIDNGVVSGQDYLDGLYKLGINAKAKNFLVFQGSVEEIALMNSGALATLFEEISTSGEFKPEYDRLKAEKLQAEKAMQFAYQIKKVMAVNRKKAKVEKQEAQKFQQLRNEYMKTDIELQLFCLFCVEKRMACLENEREEKERELAEMQDDMENEEAEFRERKKESGVLSRQLAKLEQDLREAEVTRTKMRPKFIKTKENVAYLQRKVESARKLLEKARHADEAHKKDIRELEEELAQVEADKAAYEAKVDGQSQIEMSRNVTLEATQIREYNRLKEVATAESARYLQSLDSITREQKSEQDKLDNELRKKTDVDNKMKQKRHVQLELEKRLERIEAHTKTSEAALEDLTKQRDELQSAVVGSKEKVRILQREIENISAELDDAALDKNELLRLRKKTEVVENLKAIFPGVKDRVLNLCRPIHKRYNVAVTKVVGKNMDAIVVDTERTARECIQYLKTALVEPETFLPLDYIRPSQLKERLRTIENPPNVRLIYDVLMIADQTVERAILYVAKNTLVCENAEDAIKVAYDLEPNTRYDCVALDGTYFQKSGIISGGALDLQRRAKRWDEKQMSQLNRRKEKLTEELRESLMTSRRENELNIIQSKIKNLEMLLRFGKSEVLETKKNLDLLKVEVENLKREQEKLAPAMAAIESTMAERNEEIQKIRHIIDDLEDTIFEDFCKQIDVENIRQYEERGLLSQQERDRRRMDFDNQCNRIVTQLDFEKQRETESNILRWLKAVQDAERKLRSAKHAEIYLKTEMDSEEAKKKELETRVSAKRMEVNQREEELSKWRSSLKAKAKEIVQMQRYLNTIENYIEKQKADRHAILMKCKLEDIAIPILEGDIENVSSEGDMTNGPDDSMQQQYQRESEIKIDYDRLPDELKDIEEGPEVEKAIGNLKKAMRELNSTIEQIRAPNMKASEKLTFAAEKFQETSGEFQETCRKARKITAQFDKVKKARYDRFMLTFEHVAQHIDNIYKGLVRNESAQAYIEAENPEEPYLGGINFNCVAPGKRFQLMSNLSGGEKTVAALAFLFAINSIRPSPFFVLDEIDAALDNANISRVRDYIREKSSSIQMIVISLNLEFYSKADSLIGICPDIGECLKSKVLTVDLTEYEP